MKVVDLNTLDMRGEAKRLNALGMLRITLNDRPGDRRNVVTGRVVGFAIDIDERDCLLVLGPYGMSKRNTVRCIPDTAIAEVIAVDEVARPAPWLG